MINPHKWRKRIPRGKKLKVLPLFWLWPKQLKIKSSAEDLEANKTLPVQKLEIKDNLILSLNPRKVD